MEDQVKMADDRNIREAVKRMYQIFLDRKGTALECERLAAGSYCSILTRAKRSFEAMMASSGSMLTSAISDFRLQVLTLNGHLDGIGAPEIDNPIIHRKYRILFDDSSVLLLDDQPWDPELLERIKQKLPKNLDPADGIFTLEGDARVKKMLAQMDADNS